MADELEIRLKITANPSEIAQAEVFRRAVKTLKDELSLPLKVDAFTQARDQLRASLQDELNLVKQSVDQKALTEKEGNDKRIQILQDYVQKAKALTRQFIGADQSVPGGFNRGPSTPTPTVLPDAGKTVADADAITAAIARIRQELGQPVQGGLVPTLEQQRELLALTGNDLEKFKEVMLEVMGPESALSQGVAANSAQINTLIGRFQALGKVIDVTNAEAVQAYRQEGEQLKANIDNLGAEASAISQVERAIANVEKRAGAAGATVGGPIDDAAKKTLLFGRASEATFQQVPRGARTAANALSILALSAGTAGTGMTSAVRAVGNLAFGLSTLTRSANLAAGAAGIAALATIIATMVELMARGTEKTREQERAFKNFINTEESFIERARIVNQVIADLGNARTVSNGRGVSDTFVAITKNVNDLHEALTKATKAMQDVTVPTFGERMKEVRDPVQTTADKLRFFTEDIKNLRNQFLNGKIDINQFIAGLEEMARERPDYQPFVRQMAEAASNVDALRDALRRLRAEAEQKQAVQQNLLENFGVTPDLAKSMDEVNQRFIALQRGGPLAVAAFDQEIQATKKATEAWGQYVLSKQGSQFADIAFTDALNKTSAAREAVQKRLNAELKDHVATQEQVNQRLNEAQRAAGSQLVSAFTTIQKQQLTENIPKANDALKRSNAELAILEATRLKGEVEGQREAARQETALRIDQLNQDKTIETRRSALIENERKKLALKLAEIDQQEALRVGEQTAKNAIDLAKRQEQTATSNLQGVQEAQDAALKAQLNRREISQFEFNERRLQNELNFSNQLEQIQRESIGKQQDALTKELAIPGLKAEDRNRIVGQQKQLQEELERVAADGRKRQAAARGEELDANAQLSHQIVGATEDANIELLRLQGKNAEAAKLEVEKRFRDIIADLKAMGGPGAEAAVKVQVRLEGAEAAKAEMEGLMQDVSTATDHLTAQLNDINVRVSSHLITQAQARREIVAAEEQARDAIKASLPELERQAAILGNTKASDQVLQLKTRLEELEFQIKRDSDAFFALKETARSSTEQGVADFLVGLTQLGGQDTAQIGALKDELSGARQELDDLLKIPSENRTGTQNQRITQLRAEISQTSAQLEDAKHSIKTWRDLFIEAAQSIIQALTRVVAQMLAVQAVEGILSIFGGGGGGATPVAVLSGGPSAGPDFVGAEGGPTPDIGRYGYDDINAKLTRDEFVQPPPATRYYGYGIMEALRRKLIPRELLMSFMKGLGPLTVRTPSFAFATGGLATTESTALRGASTRSRHYLQVAMADGLVARKIRTPDGADAVMEVVRDHAHQLRGILD